MYQVSYNREEKVVILNDNSFVSIVLDDKQTEILYKNNPILLPLQSDNSLNMIVETIKGIRLP